MGPLDDQVLRPDSLTAVPGGIDVAVYSHWYRALPLSCVTRVEMSLDDISDFSEVSVGGCRFRLSDLPEVTDEYWFTTDPLVVHVTGSFGSHVRVRLELGLAIPYILTGPGRVPLLSSSRSDKTLKVTRD